MYQRPLKKPSVRRLGGWKRQLKTQYPEIVREGLLPALLLVLKYERLAIGYEPTQRARELGYFRDGMWNYQMLKPIIEDVKAAVQVQKFLEE